MRYRALYSCDSVNVHYVISFSDSGHSGDSHCHESPVLHQDRLFSLYIERHVRAEDKILPAHPVAMHPSLVVC